MRKITKESSEAFVNFEQYNKSNTEVAIKYGYSPSDEIARFYLHGNCIAEITRSTLPECQGLKSIEIDLCGWRTPTTRERINGVLEALGYDFRIAQRKGEQVLIKERDILKLSDDSFDPDFAQRVFDSEFFETAIDLNAITDF